MTMNGEIIFVLSDTRSGSTLLDQLLGAHTDIVSLGELHWLDAYVRQDRSIYNPVHPLVCTCGETVPECDFWRQVAAVLDKPLDSLYLRLLAHFEEGRGGLRAKLRRIVARHPRAFRYRIVQSAFGGRRLAADSCALYDAIFRVADTPYVVDSSKSPFRFRALYTRTPSRVRAILLSRDYRAVVHSKMKRGRSLEAAAAGWRRRMIDIAELTADVPDSQKYKLKYESLCADPERELRSICAFLNLPFSSAMLRRPREGIHHIGGSPSKFDAERVAISLDTEYQTAFDLKTLEALDGLVGEAAATWGYRGYSPFESRGAPSGSASSGHRATRP